MRDGSSEDRGEVAGEAAIPCTDGGGEAREIVGREAGSFVLDAFENDFVGTEKSVEGREGESAVEAAGATVRQGVLAVGALVSGTGHEESRRDGKIPREDAS
jgi:hypothetical protein